jgi:hypothetical protein
VFFQSFSLSASKDGLRSARPLATGVRDDIQAGDGVQVVPAGHKDNGVSNNISRASCQ